MSTLRYRLLFSAMVAFGLFIWLPIWVVTVTARRLYWLGVDMLCLAVYKVLGPDLDG